MPDPISTPAQMREAAARLIDDRCADILSKQDGKIPEVDQNLRLMAVFLPDLAAAIRALPVAEPCTYKPSMDPNDAGECVNCGQAAGAHKVAEPAPQAVRVKPLVFCPAMIMGVRGWVAGEYEGYLWRWRYADGDWNDEADNETAQAAAKADHAARVLSQIRAMIEKDAT